jgi:hypothetical protein
MEGRFDRLILVPGTGFEPARVRAHPIASKAIASTDSDHPGTVILKAGAGNGAQENPLSVPAILGGGLGNKENSPRHELFVVMNIEITPRCLGYGARGAVTSRAPRSVVDNTKLLLKGST